MVCQWNLNLWELSGSVCGFTGASVNSKERLGARVGLCNFVGASGIFGSVCEMYCTKKITPWKNFSFSLHEQDQGDSRYSWPGWLVCVQDCHCYWYCYYCTTWLVLLEATTAGTHGHDDLQLHVRSVASRQLRDMVRYGMLWYDMVWYDMVWYGMVWYGMV